MAFDLAHHKELRRSITHAGPCCRCAQNGESKATFARHARRAHEPALELQTAVNDFCYGSARNRTD